MIGYGTIVQSKKDKNTIGEVAYSKFGYSVQGFDEKWGDKYFWKTTGMSMEELLLDWKEYNDEDDYSDEADDMNFDELVLNYALSNNILYSEAYKKLNKEV